MLAATGRRTLYRRRIRGEGRGIRTATSANEIGPRRRGG